MRLTFALGAVTVTLACVMMGEFAPSFGDQSAERDGAFYSVDDPLDDEDAGVDEENGKSVASSEVRLGARGGSETGATNEKRGRAVWEDAWAKGHRADRRAFSPWGGKRYFNPWGGKRFRGLYLERKADSVFDKRPGFQPWGGKRAAEWGSEAEEKRAFNPWGGKRMSRDQLEGLLVRHGLDANKKLLFE